MNKPVRKATEDDLPSVDSHDEGSDSWTSGIDDEDISVSGSASDENSSEDGELSADDLDSDTEMPYEVAPRKRRPSWDSGSDRNIHHLPTKSANGRIQKSAAKPTTLVNSDIEDEESEGEASEQAEKEENYRVEDVSTGARFGRLAVADIIGNKSRKARIQGAKDQIAGVCQEIIADPENSVSTTQ